MSGNHNSGRRPKAVESRIAAMITVRALSGCWEWTGTIFGGVPQVWSGGAATKEGEAHLNVRHYLHTREHGALPQRGVIKMECGNSTCVNPAHMRVALHGPYPRKKKEITR